MFQPIRGTSSGSPGEYVSRIHTPAHRIHRGYSLSLSVFLFAVLASIGSCAGRDTSQHVNKENVLHVRMFATT